MDDRYAVDILDLYDVEYTSAYYRQALGGTERDTR